MKVLAWWNGQEVETDGKIEDGFIVATITNHPENCQGWVGQNRFLAPDQYPEVCANFGIQFTEKPKHTTFKGKIPQVPW